MKIKTPSSIFLFQKGPKFQAWDRGTLVLEVNPRGSKASRVGYHMLFVLYGLPAKIIYNGLGIEPKDVDHLEYYPTHKDFVFLRNFQRFLPKLDKTEELEKFLGLVRSFYGEKAEKVREYLESWGFWIKPVTHDSFSQNAKVVIA